MPDNDQITDVELRQMADQIEADGLAGRFESVSMLQALYLDRVYEKRQLTAEALINECCLYLGDPEVSRQHPSLMDACDGRPATAAKYVVWLMITAEADGISWSLSAAAGECERAFASLVHGGARLHR